MFTLGIIALFLFAFKWVYNAGRNRGKQKAWDELKQDIESKQQLIDHYTRVATEQHGNPFAFASQSVDAPTESMVGG